MLAKCHECGYEIDVVSPEVGKTIECPGCSLRLRIVAISLNRIYFETEESEEEEIL